MVGIFEIEIVCQTGSCTVQMLARLDGSPHRASVLGPLEAFMQGVHCAKDHSLPPSYDERPSGVEVQIVGPIQCFRESSTLT